MQIRFPYPGVEGVNYYVSQGYDSNPFNPQTNQRFYSVHHGGWDIVPLTGKYGNFWPAAIFPVLPGRTMGTSVIDANRGLGIQVRTVLDSPLIAYFKRLGHIPAGYTGEVWLDHLYWHMLTVTDLDGWVDEAHQVGLTGNSGYVFAGGVPVPDSQHNVPPYPGGHLHFEYYLRSPNEVFNLNLDALGRLHPELLWGYKEIAMAQLKAQLYKGEKRIVMQVSSEQQWIELCKVMGIDPNHIDETVN